MNQTIKKRIEQIGRGEVPDGYKKTKAGLMPCAWMSGKTYKARDVFYSVTNKKHSGQYEVLSATQDRGVIPRSQVDIDIKYSEESVSGYKKVDKGDFVISLRSFQGGIEYSEYEGLVSPAYTVLKNKLPICDGYYKAYFKMNDYINRLNKGTYGIRDGKQVGFEDFGDMVIHYPPIEEQERIAEILETQDKLIALKEKRIAEKKQQKKYLMQQLLTGKKRLPGFTNEWKKVKLGACISEVNERSQGNGQYDILSVTKDGIVFQSDHFNKQIASEDTTGYKILKKGQLAFSSMNLWLGSLDVLDICEKGIVSPAYKVFSFDDTLMLPEFGKYFLRTHKMVWVYKSNSEQGASVVRRNLDLEAVLSTIIEIPSIIEQKRMVGILSQADKEIELLQKDLEEEKNKKKALMQLLLTGIIRTNNG